MRNCSSVIVISSFQRSSAPPPPPTPTKIIVAVLHPSLLWAALCPPPPAPQLKTLPDLPEFLPPKQLWDLVQQALQSKGIKTKDCTGSFTKLR